MKDHDPPALCTPTSLFSLRLSLQPQNTDSHTDAPIAKTYATAEGTSAKRKKKSKRKLFRLRLRSACVWLQLSCRTFYPFTSPQTSNYRYLLLVLLWLRSVVVLFRLYSIFLSHFRPFPSSFFIDEHDSYPCFLLPVAVFSARLKAACVKRTSTAT